MEMRATRNNESEAHRGPEEWKRRRKREGEKTLARTHTHTHTHTASVYIQKEQYYSFLAAVTASSLTSSPDARASLFHPHMHTIYTHSSAYISYTIHMYVCVCVKREETADRSLVSAA